LAAIRRGAVSDGNTIAAAQEELCEFGAGGVRPAKTADVQIAEVLYLNSDGEKSRRWSRPGYRRILDVQPVDVSPKHSWDIVLEHRFLEIGGRPAKIEIAGNQIANILASSSHGEM